MSKITIENACANDMPGVFSLIKELAVYEKAAHEVITTVEQLQNDGFGNNPLFWVLLAKEENTIVGISFYYIRYSTWKGKCLYLEDLVVKESHRRKHIGSLLFEATIERAKNIACTQMVWQVLDWNTPAIEFYKKYDAKLNPEWINGQLIFEQI